MRESQYIEDYLRQAEQHRWTPGTYLHYTLAGRAKDYSASYQRALQRAIDRRVQSGDVVPVRSAGARVAYVRRDDAPRP